MSMRPFTHTITLAEAKTIIDAGITPLMRHETIVLDDARGRVVAADVVSALDVPPFDRASMDGYAVIAADTRGASADAPTPLTMTARVYTGDMPDSVVRPGTCMEIATGAPMPAGADAVVMVEDTSANGDRINVRTAIRVGQNVGPRAADIAIGHTVLREGDVLNASRVGALAAIGAAAVNVWARPSVAILSTGNEIATQGTALAPGQIYDINRYTLSAIVQDHGGIAHPISTARDTLPALHAAIDACLAHDLIIFSGGSSVGERDLILDVVRERGEVRFHGIAVKPGKPTLFGMIEGKPVFGMPGYPSSCLSNAYILLVPVLRRMAHLPLTAPRTMRMPLAARVASTPGRHQFYTVRVENGTAVPAFKASGDITSMSRADGYIEIEAEITEVPAGTEVTVTVF
ncbi:MAG: molybdopterin molybdotransferase MoeA [Acidobacteria bacterium]|nr:molybdopterin molybdotransferase MoeA [Acidobacteriota bacterium]